MEEAKAKERQNMFLKCIQTNDIKGLKTFDDIYNLIGKLDSNNQTPLYHGIEANNNNLEALEYLLKFFPSTINIESKGFRTSLNLAVSNNRIDIVKLLLTYDKINVDCPDLLGRTPLQIAASKGFVDIVRLLLEHHANPNNVDKHGMTPSSEAQSEEISNLLRQYIEDDHIELIHCIEPVDRIATGNNGKDVSKVMQSVDEVIEWSVDNKIEDLYLIMLRSLRERIECQARS